MKLLSISEPTHYKKMEIEFLRKRAECGEPWANQDSNTLGRDDSLVATTHTFKNYTFNQGLMSSNTFPSSKFTKKRKQSFDYCSHPWSQNLLQNLTKCDTAINFQQIIMAKMLENNIVSTKKPGFIKIEQELVKLAKIDNCCSGCFSYSAFKCSIDSRPIIYIRYVESGVYIGLMAQKFLNQLKEKFSVSDDEIFLHKVMTHEDIQTKSTKPRPDKVFKHTTEIILPKLLKDIESTTSCSEIELNSFFFHALPFKAKASIEKPSKHFLYTNTDYEHFDLNECLIDFRLHRNECYKEKSLDILKDDNRVNLNLLDQSILLNCLSGDTSPKNMSNFYKRENRFESHFIGKCLSTTSTSLRKWAFHLYLKNDFSSLINYFICYFPQLGNSNEDSATSVIREHVSLPKIRKTSLVQKSTKVTPQDLQENFNIKCPIQDASATLFQTYSVNLLEHGKFYIQSLNPTTGDIVCILNDYNESDGSFKFNDFVYTIRYKQEAMDYLKCSCKVFSTLLVTGQDATNDTLDASDNSVTCIHCRFLKEKVLPSLNRSEQSSTMSHVEVQVKEALEYNGNSIIELNKNGDTRKYSIVSDDDDVPSFVHLTFNRRLNKFIVSCLNGKCRSKKGHKKTLNNFQSSNLCKHLTALKQQTNYWIHLTENDSSVQFILDEENLDTNFQDIEISEFDDESGLWQFPSISKHSPQTNDSQILQRNVQRRDTWNDQNLIRLADGSFKGPILSPDIPLSTCDCGAGWLKSHEDVDYCENGLTVLDKKRSLTVYTQLAPVKCDIQSRICYNSGSPCKIMWDEGLSDSLHVLSRDTAAGDEIGWEFVSMVFNSDCTFSSFCNIKNQLYKSRNSKACFMDQSVFVKWWFSWASNMKIDFRIPCDVCKFEPKRLCCDGTKVGVGFRNANFEEINKFSNGNTINETLHRRMDRCFLKNMNGLEKKAMIQNRLTLDYLAKLELGELRPDEILHPDELLDRINRLKHVLPEEVLPSFERLNNMMANEKIAFASVLKILATTSCITSFLPPTICPALQELLSNLEFINADRFNTILRDLRSYSPELRDLIAESILSNNSMLPADIRLFLQYLVNESLNINYNIPEPAVNQPKTYNPAKFGRAYYFNQHGLKLRNVRKFTIDNDRDIQRNNDHDDPALEFERCNKLYSKVQTSAPGTSNLFLWFCADHGHCYGFHMTGAEGRKDPSASLYSYLDSPPDAIFYDFACNLQEYCLNRESGYYKNVRFFHDIFHGYAHKCSTAFRSSRLQGFESVNTEICEQFNSFIQHIKKSARQMSQTHFCFYLQFFLHQWNKKKTVSSEKEASGSFVWHEVVVTSLILITINGLFVAYFLF